MVEIQDHCITPHDGLFSPVDAPSAIFDLTRLSVAVEDKMKLRNALFALSGLCGLFLPVWGARSNIRERVSRRIPPSHTIHERHAPRNLEGWVKRELVDSEATVPVRIGLKQSNVDAGHDLLMDM